MVRSICFSQMAKSISWHGFWVSYLQTYLLISTWNSISLLRTSILFFIWAEFSIPLTNVANISLNAMKWRHNEMNSRNNWAATAMTKLKMTISAAISPKYPTNEFWFHGRLRQIPWSYTVSWQSVISGQYLHNFDRMEQFSDIDVSEPKF